MVITSAERRVHLRMQQRDLRKLTGRYRKAAGQVVRHTVGVMPYRSDVPNRYVSVIVDREASGSPVRCNLNGVGPGKRAWAGSRSARVVISRGVHDGDTVIAEALSLLEKEALGLEREPLAVEEITGDQEGVHVLVNREIDGIAERLTGCVAEPLPYPLGSAGK